MPTHCKAQPKTNPFVRIAVTAGICIALASGCDRGKANGGKTGPTESTGKKTHDIEVPKDPQKMTAEEIDAADKLADVQIAATSRLAREHIEELLSQLRYAALQEAELSNHKSATQIEEMVLSDLDQGVYNSESVRQFKPVFSRLKTRDAVEAIAAALDAAQTKIAELSNAKPSNIIGNRWGSIVSEGNALAATVKNLRATLLEQPTVTGNSYENISARIDDVDKKNKTAGAELRACRQKIADIQNRLADFAIVSPAYSQASATSQKVLGTLIDNTEIYSADLSPMIAHHRTLLASIADKPLNVTTAIATSNAIKQDQVRHPDYWRIDQLTAAYTQHIEAVYAGAAGNLNAQSQAAITELGVLLNFSVDNNGADYDRGGILSLVTRLEENDADLKRRAKHTASVLREVQASYMKLADAAGSSSVATLSSSRAADELTPYVQKADELALTDRSATYAYHRNFLANLSSEPTSVSGANTFGAAVREAKSNQPEHWSFAPLANAYSSWQRRGYSELMQGSCGVRLRDCFVAYKSRASSRANNDRWLTAAQSLTADEINGLAMLFDSNLLDAQIVPGRAELLAMLRDARGVPALRLLPKESLSRFNGYEMARLLGLQEPAASYHAELVAKFNANRTVADIATMKVTVASERTLKPSMWKDSQKTTAWYAKQQSAQWRQFWSDRFGDGILELAQIYRERLSNDASESKWSGAARKLAKDRSEAAALQKLLDQDAIDPVAVKDEFVSMGFRLDIENTASDFWDDVISVFEIDEYRATAICPFNAYRLARELKIDARERAYHLGILQKMSRASTLDEVASLSEQILRGVESRSDEWTSQEVVSLYLLIQTKQFVSYVEKAGLDKAMVKFRRDIERLSPGEQDALARRVFSRADAEGMAAILNRGFFTIVDARDPASKYFTTQKQMEMEDAMGLLNAPFWKNVAALHNSRR